MQQPAGIPPEVTTRLATSRTLPLETQDLGTFDDFDLLPGKFEMIDGWIYLWRS